ncbi:TetR/AcrR family transcriptional regulator [Mucilaginibacter sp. X5P1]|uniref:TetR/AcrR family transcriptional regulator n=1 Tax=Mucilaginibacter sp. X5P1 TaxID=2723088 RepID=UPI00161F8079|nr:TetR/AcrR family transcriptional regulator [Mucilaginibacter sp. X5P1]MBB6137704.1 AcrR family transcriptional regulator [Mucilaginibacter sp. X5P1]
MSKSQNPQSGRNKAATIRKLIQAVGQIVRSEGFPSLTISAIARTAGVDRNTIYRNFRTLDYLVEAYIIETDYWMVFADQMKKMLSERKFENDQQMITAVLQNLFKFFFTEKDMQLLILWELSTESKLMKSIHNTRESMGQRFLEIIDPYFQNTNVNFRSVSALLVGGIYYIILHTIYNGGMFVDLDISSEKGREEILKAIEQIVGWAFKEVE